MNSLKDCITQNASTLGMESVDYGLEDTGFLGYRLNFSGERLSRIEVGIKTTW